MRLFKRQLLELFKVNLIYANPQVSAQLRKKGKQGNEIFKSVVIQQVMLSFVFTFVYGMSMFMIDFSQYPGYFTYYLGIFSILGFSQGIFIVYNVYFDSKDVEDYLPLPFSERSVFLAKFLSVGFFIIPFMLPILALFILTAIRSSVSLFIMLPFSLILFVLFFILYLELVTYFVSFLIQTKIFQRFKTTFTTLLMFIPTVGMLVGILYMNRQQTNIGEMSQLKDQKVITILKPFHQLINEPFSLDALLAFLIIVALVVLLGLLIKEKTLPKIRNQVNTTSQKKKKTTYKSLRRQLISYHFSLIKNPTLQLQILSGLFIFPIIIVFPFLANGTDFLQTLETKYFALFFVVGIIFAMMTLSVNSLASVIISLDQDNLMFIKSLPIAFKEYIKLKYYFAFFLQFISILLIMLIGGLVLKVPIILVLALIFGALLGCLAGTSHFIRDDSRHLSLNWTNINQLFNRGSGAFRIMGIMFGTMIIGGIIVFFLYTITSTIKNSLLLNMIVLGITTLLVSLYQLRMKKVFWEKMEG